MRRRSADPSLLLDLRVEAVGDEQDPLARADVDAQGGDENRIGDQSPDDGLVSGHADDLDDRGAGLVRATAVDVQDAGSYRLVHQLLLAAVAS
jgi:hypothetical protein